MLTDLERTLLTKIAEDEVNTLNQQLGNQVAILKNGEGHCRSDGS